VLQEKMAFRELTQQEYQRGKKKAEKTKTPKKRNHKGGLNYKYS
jgi:hypothetical protein